MNSGLLPVLCTVLHTVMQAAKLCQFLPQSQFLYVNQPVTVHRGSPAAMEPSKQMVDQAARLAGAEYDLRIAREDVQRLQVHQALTSWYHARARTCAGPPRCTLCNMR